MALINRLVFFYYALFVFFCFLYLPGYVYSEVLASTYLEEMGFSPNHVKSFLIGDSYINSDVKLTDENKIVDCYFRDILKKTCELLPSTVSSRNSLEVTSTISANAFVYYAVCKDKGVASWSSMAQVLESLCIRYFWEDVRDDADVKIVLGDSGADITEICRVAWYYRLSLLESASERVDDIVLHFPCSTVDLNKTVTDIFGHLLPVLDQKRDPLILLEECYPVVLDFLAAAYMASPAFPQSELIDFFSFRLPPCIQKEPAPGSREQQVVPRIATFFWGINGALRHRKAGRMADADDGTVGMAAVLDCRASAIFQDLLRSFALDQVGLTKKANAPEKRAMLFLMRILHAFHCNDLKHEMSEMSEMEKLGISFFEVPVAFRIEDLNDLQDKAGMAFFLRNYYIKMELKYKDTCYLDKKAKSTAITVGQLSGNEVVVQELSHYKPSYPLIILGTTFPEEAMWIVACSHDQEATVEGSHASNDLNYRLSRLDALQRYRRLQFELAVNTIYGTASQWDRQRGSGSDPWSVTFKDKAHGGDDIVDHASVSLPSSYERVSDKRDNGYYDLPVLISPIRSVHRKGNRNKNIFLNNVLPNLIRAPVKSNGACVTFRIQAKKVATMTGIKQRHNLWSVFCPDFSVSCDDCVASSPNPLVLEPHLVRGISLPLPKRKPDENSLLSDSKAGGFDCTLKKIAGGGEVLSGNMQQIRFPGIPLTEEERKATAIQYYNMPLTVTFTTDPSMLIGQFVDDNFRDFERKMKTLKKSGNGTILLTHFFKGTFKKDKESAQWKDMVVKKTTFRWNEFLVSTRLNHDNLLQPFFIIMGNALQEHPRRRTMYYFLPRFDDDLHRHIRHIRKCYIGLMAQFGGNQLIMQCVDRNISFIIESIAEALLYLHTQRPIIVHHDVKASNILIRKKCDCNNIVECVCTVPDYQVVLADFDASKDLEDGVWPADIKEEKKKTGNVSHLSPVGTVGYKSPEMLYHQVASDRSMFSHIGCKADMFQFGLLVTWLFVGIDGIDGINGIDGAYKREFGVNLPQPYICLIHHQNDDLLNLTGDDQRYNQPVTRPEALRSKLKRLKYGDGSSAITDRDLEYHANRMERFYQGMEGKLKKNQPLSSVSSELSPYPGMINLCTELLQPRCEQRMSSLEVVNHPWIVTKGKDKTTPFKRGKTSG